MKKSKEINTKISIRKITSIWLYLPNTPALLPDVNVQYSYGIQNMYKYISFLLS